MIWRGLPPIPNKIVSHVRQDFTISISWAEGSKSSVQPSSNGSWFCPMRCLTLTPSFFLGSTGQGVQQASTGCSQVNPEMPRSKGPLIHFGTGWDDSLFVEKTSTKRVPTVVALDGACYFAWGLPWFGGLSFVSRLWFEECLKNTPFKMPFSNYDPKTCNLHPTCTQPAPNLHNCGCQKQTAVAICCQVS